MRSSITSSSESLEFEYTTVGDYNLGNANTTAEQFPGSHYQDSGKFHFLSFSFALNAAKLFIRHLSWASRAR